MRLRALLIALLLSTLGFAQNMVLSIPTPTESEFINDTLFPATALLYNQDQQGGMNMRCTATAFEKTEKGYRFVTAAHCVAKDNETRRKAEPDKTFFFITLDNAGTKEFMKAELVVAGYQHKEDDFSILEVETDAKLPLVAIGEDVQDRTGHAVVNIASPLGLGKQTFKGNISSPKLDRPVHAEDINWTNAVLMQMPGTNGGSSGSAVVSLQQRAICAFLVGTIGGTTEVGIPVSKFKKFYQTFKDGKYKYWEVEE